MGFVARNFDSDTCASLQCVLSCNGCSVFLDISYFAYQNGLEPDFPRRLEAAVRNSGHIWRHSKVLDLIQPGLKIEIDRVLGEVEAEADVEA